jgi:2-polyprenyl-6-methoxyphenol hydroxylase-like FAD-dependent oxidoreductase
MQQPKIVIVGGSLVGPAGDLFLRKQGFTDITVLEANPHPFNQSGGVMGVRKTTIDRLAEIGIRADDIKALNDSNVYAFDVNGTEYPTRRNVSEFPGMTTSWDALHFELGRRVNVHLGHHVTRMHSDAARQYLVCSCGSIHEADVVLWADGRKSTGRTILDPQRALRYNGYVVWRGLVDPPADTPSGFHRYYDIEGGRLFSLTEPVAQSGKSYFEFSHNLAAEDWEALTGRRPESYAYMLPTWANKHRADVLNLIRQHAVGMPHRFEEMIEHATISGIPVNDVAFPDHLIHVHPGGGQSVLFGDAAVPVRLQVGAGLNNGLAQMYGFVQALTYDDVTRNPWAWESKALDELRLWVEQGRSRAHRNNLGCTCLSSRVVPPLPRATSGTPRSG